MFLCVQFSKAFPLTVNNFYALNYYNEDKSNPSIKFVLFRTGKETPEQLALVPKIQTIAHLYGAHKIEEREMPSDGNQTYQSVANVPLHNSWYKVQVTREIMTAADLQAEWLLTFELSAIPTDSSAASINFAALISENCSTSVFLKRVGMGFGMAMYKNDQETREVIEKIWEKKSATGSVMAAFTNFTFWNPKILLKVKFI